MQLVAALVERAEQHRRKQDADRVVAAHQRHRDADEAGVGDVVERDVCCTPTTWLTATMPASAPETS